MYKTIIILVYLLTITNLGYADLQRSVDSLKLEIEKNPDDYLLHFKLGNCYYSLGQYGDALLPFKKAAKLKQDFFPAELKNALSYFHLDSLEIAKNELEIMRECYPDNNSIYKWLGVVYGYTGAYEKMLLAFEKYNELASDEFFKNPTNRDHDLWYQCGKAAAMLGRYAEATKYYHKSIDYYKTPYVLEMELAMIYSKTGDRIKARKWLDKSIKDLKLYDFSQEEALWTASIYYYCLGEYDDAIIKVDRILKNSSEAIAIYNRGVFRIAAGDREGIADIRKALETDTSAFVQATYNAILAINSDSLTNAEKLLKQDIPGLRRSGIAKGLLAWVLEKLDEGIEAKKYWFECYGQLPLGTDVESMRSFIDKFIQTMKEAESSP